MSEYQADSPTSEDGLTQDEREIIKIPSKKAQKAMSKKKKESPVAAPAEAPAAVPAAVPVTVEKKKRAPRKKKTPPGEQIPKEVQKVLNTPAISPPEDPFKMFRTEFEEIKTKGFSQVQSMAQEIENLKKQIAASSSSNSSTEIQELRKEMAELKSRKNQIQLGERENNLLQRMIGK